MARKSKRSQAVREQEAAEQVEPSPQPLKHLQEVDFYTLWNQCKKSPDYDLKAWVAAEAKLSRAFGVMLKGDAPVGGRDPTATPVTVTSGEGGGP